MKKILIALIATLAIVQVLLSNSLVTGGRRMKDLSAQKDELMLQLSGMENQIAEASSLSIIKAKAQKLGMRPAPLKVLSPSPVATTFKP